MPKDLAGRNFFKELASLVGSVVAVTTTEGKTYTGELKGYNPSSLSVCLASTKDGEGRSFHRLVLNGSIVRHIAKTEEPFDLKTLANEIQRIFPPGEVKYIEEARVIQVLDKIKVTESGVEGSGPLTERVKTIYEKFVEQRGKK